jgi:hypothetical protein
MVLQILCCSEGGVAVVCNECVDFGRSQFKTAYLGAAFVSLVVDASSG